mmetsp:Transcript_84517/g.149217  ORF Transcript_84517/g.149217 Transcript_84517/m.149217 type:complete len:98 (-) Transcript_84517:62-355(-)
MTFATMPRWLQGLHWRPLQKHSLPTCTTFGSSSAPPSTFCRIRLRTVSVRTTCDDDDDVKDEEDESEFEGESEEDESEVDDGSESSSVHSGEESVSS